MPDPITIITTLHGLAAKLVNSIKSGQDAAKAKEILRLVGELQTEYFGLKQHILKIETDNAKLVAQVATLQSPNPKQKDDGGGKVIDLNDACAKMLQSVAAAAPDDITKKDLFAQLGLPPAKGEHLFNQLIEHKFIEQRGVNLLTGVRYGATPKGSNYLDRKGLL